MEGYPGVKLKLDESLSRHLTPALSALGHDVESVHDEGLSGQHDDVIAAAARREQRMLLTLDVEFANVAQYPPGEHPGIILFRPRSSGPLEVTRLIMEFAEHTDLASILGCVVVVEYNRVRVRRPHSALDP